jgi:L-threonylcarbamoyladenylate synthase
VLARGVTAAARLVRHGGVVAYPTEYCFGLGCDPFNRDAVFKLLRLKKRSAKKGVILIAASLAQLKPFVREIPANARATWPGPATWLLEPAPGVPHWITGGHNKIAVRVTAHPLAAALCRAAGTAIVSTSANRAGQTPARTDREARRRFGGSINAVVIGRVGTSPAPTPIRDAATGATIRAGVRWTNRPVTLAPSFRP